MTKINRNWASAKAKSSYKKKKCSLELKKHIDRSSSILECPEPVRHKLKSETPDKFQFKSINMTAFSIIIIIELFLEPKNL